MVSAEATDPPSQKDAALKSVKSSNRKLVLPSKVTSIADADDDDEEGAVEGCAGLTSVVIPDSVTEEGGSAFYGCDRLKSVSLSKKTKYKKRGWLGQNIGSLIATFEKGCIITHR